MRLSDRVLALPTDKALIPNTERVGAESSPEDELTCPRLRPHWPPVSCRCKGVNWVCETEARMKALCPISRHLLPPLLAQGNFTFACCFSPRPVTLHNQPSSSPCSQQPLQSIALPGQLLLILYDSAQIPPLPGSLPWFS